MTLASTLAALCDMLRARTGAPVVLGYPDEAIPGIYVWPWKLEEHASHKSSPRSKDPAVTGARETPARNVHFLLLVRPALTADGLLLLDTARQALYDQPILDIAGRKARIQFSPLTQGDLIALFTAASLPVTLCLSAELVEIHEQ
jgi:hypothetical protein